MSDEVVHIRGLSVAYNGRPVVRDVDLEVAPRTILALVGESGCGKSSTALAAARLLPANATVSGQVSIGDLDVLALDRAELLRHRGELVGYVPQSTSAALNPVRSVGAHLTELFRLRVGLTRAEARERAAQSLVDVEIADPDRVLRLYQHQLSGGMRQRISIALALALRPRLLIADEPTTALDTTVQREILDLVQRLCAEHGTTVIWITHDLAVVGALADSVAVMYAGRVVEHAEARELFEHPRHPYTAALLDSFRSGSDGAARTPFAAIAGQPPTRQLPSGCAFHPRCAAALDRCRTDRPTRVVLGERHAVECHLVGDVG